MINLLEYYLVHASSTFPSMRVDEAKIDHWHKAPRRNPDGTITYLGKTYPDLELAPLQPQHVGKWGNGWDRYGYWKIIHRDGTETILTPIDSDDYVTNDEMTWGAAGVNRKSVHVCLEGGYFENRKKPKTLQGFLDLFTEQQFYTLQNDIKKFIFEHPNIKIAGHNQFTNKKLCPGFNVPDFLGLLGLSEYSL